MVQGGAEMNALDIAARLEDCGPDMCDWSAIDEAIKELERLWDENMRLRTTLSCIGFMLQEHKGNI